MARLIFRTVKALVCTLVLTGCSEEECVSLIPGQVADRIASRGYTCNDLDLLGLGTVLGVFYDDCARQLIEDPGYQWHCGQHDYFNGDELRALCHLGLKEFSRRCREAQVDTSSKKGFISSRDRYE